MHKQLAAFVEGIRASGLLGPEQVDQIAASALDDDADPQAIAKAIVQKGWLTAFQVKLFWKGRGQELILSQYVLRDRLGEGGMGEVFLARHRRMDRDVALKVIRKERLGNPDAVKRFGREIQAAALLAHENIVMAYDADQSGDRTFFAMEYVEGTNLAKLVKEVGPLPVMQACDCIRQAALGLQHAFERGMIHRDIKPSNLLLSKNGVVKLLDMGLARLLESPTGEQESRITQEGLVVGTPDYLAPEQARNARTADIRADIYSLGCTFYAILTAHPPYPGSTPTEKMLKHTTEPTPMVTRPDVHPAVAGVIYKMMAKRPEERFQTPAEIAFALQSFANGMPIMTRGNHPTPRPTPVIEPFQPPPPPPVYPAPPARSIAQEPRTDSQFRLPPPKPRTKPLRRPGRWNSLIAIALGLIFVGLMASGAYYLFRNDKEPPPPTVNLEPEFKNALGMRLVLIKPGTFDMGSRDGEPGRAQDEGPVHPVKITKAYYMMTTEVTLRQYYEVTKRYPSFKDEPEEVDAPVANINLNDVNIFIRKLNADSTMRKSGWEFRLPTEAEWEYACRAGTKTRFHTGENLDHSQATFGDRKATGPGKVARFPANAWELQDMHGNVAEWVSDFYDSVYYTNSPTDDPQGPDHNRAKQIARGGSFKDETAEACRSARRQVLDTTVRLPNVGFRLALAPIGKPGG